MLKKLRDNKMMQLMKTICKMHKFKKGLTMMDNLDKIKSWNMFIGIDEDEGRKLMQNINEANDDSNKDRMCYVKKCIISDHRIDCIKRNNSDSSVSSSDNEKSTLHSKITII